MTDQEKVRRADEWRGKVLAVRENLRRHGIRMSEVAKCAGLSRERIAQTFSPGWVRPQRKTLCSTEIARAIEECLRRSLQDGNRTTPAIGLQMSGFEVIERTSTRVLLRCLRCRGERWIGIPSWRHGPQPCSACYRIVAEDLTGRSFGKRLVLGLADEPGVTKWWALCECGHLSAVTAHNLAKTGECRSCSARMAYTDRDPMQGTRRTPAVPVVVLARERAEAVAASAVLGGA